MNVFSLSHSQCEAIFSSPQVPFHPVYQVTCVGRESESWSRPPVSDSSHFHGPEKGRSWQGVSPSIYFPDVDTLREISGLKEFDSRARPAQESRRLSQCRSLHSRVVVSVAHGRWNAASEPHKHTCGQELGLGRKQWSQSITSDAKTSSKPPALSIGDVMKTIRRTQQSVDGALVKVRLRKGEAHRSFPVCLNILIIDYPVMGWSNVCESRFAH